MRRYALIALACVVVLAGGYYLVGYITHGRFIETTDDAYVKADTAAIAARVAGYVAKVHVRDNQSVKTGDVLVSIDDADFKASVAQAKAVSAAKTAALASADARLQLGLKLIEAAEAQVESAVADQKRAAGDLDRAKDLRATGSGSSQRYDSALADSRKADAAVASAMAALAAEREQLVVAETSRALAIADIDAANAALELAQLNLDHTLIRAPFDGVVGARSVQNGQYVRAGAQMMAVVQLSDVHVVANFKETQAGAMRRGQKVEIKVDAFPGVRLEGRIDSFSPATGSEFSLLPPENATGNFTKVVQRLPVKVVIDDEAGLATLLRPGMSVLVSVDVRGEGEGAASVLAPSPRPVEAAGGR